MEKKLKTPKKLTIDIPESYHRRMKTRAITRNITLRKWAIQALMERVIREESVE